jgi:hypothetical protein
MESWIVSQWKNENISYYSCPCCRTELDTDLILYQGLLRVCLNIKQKQPNNTKIDDILFDLKYNRKSTIQWILINIYSFKAKDRYKWWYTIPKARESSKYTFERKRENKYNFKNQFKKKYNSY